MKIGDRGTLHFEDPSAIGYNGVWVEIKMVREKNGRKQYLCESIKGTAVVWAYEEEIIHQQFKQQKTMIANYLKKLQELQLRTVGTQVCMQIQNRWDKEAGEPWLAITVYHEDWLDADDDDLYLRTSIYEWSNIGDYTLEETEALNLKIGRAHV